jgi:hypothetical protein
MALKPDREEFHYDIRWYMDTAAERGGVVCVQTADSGGYPGGRTQRRDLRRCPVGPLPVGVLLYDVVDYDASRMHGNPYRMQTLKGTKVALIKDGWVTTNMIVPGDAPAVGRGCVSGCERPLHPGRDTGGNPKVGQFLGRRTRTASPRSVSKSPKEPRQMAN